MTTTQPDAQPLRHPDRNGATHPKPSRARRKRRDSAQAATTPQVTGGRGSGRKPDIPDPHSLSHADTPPNPNLGGAGPPGGTAGSASSRSSRVTSGVTSRVTEGRVTEDAPKIAVHKNPPTAARVRIGSRAMSDMPAPGVPVDPGRATAAQDQRGQARNVVGVRVAKGVGLGLTSAQVNASAPPPPGWPDLGRIAAQRTADYQRRRAQLARDRAALAAARAAGLRARHARKSGGRR